MKDQEGTNGSKRKAVCKGVREEKMIASTDVRLVKLTVGRLSIL
jgi:hypothetical protein